MYVSLSTKLVITPFSSTDTFTEVEHTSKVNTDKGPLPLGCVTEVTFGSWEVTTGVEDVVVDTHHCCTPN